MTRERNSAGIRVGPDVVSDVSSLSVRHRERVARRSRRKKVFGDDPASHPMILRLPNTSFGVSLGLAGNAILWKMAGEAEFIDEHLDTNLANRVFWFIALVSCTSTSMLYFYKILLHWNWIVQEYKHPTRIHFMNAPHLILTMLTLSVPRDIIVSNPVALDAIFSVSLAVQVILTQIVYERWLFSTSGSSLTQARPQFLLSTVGWFLVANLGLSIDIKGRWGLSVPSFCLGIGFCFYAMVTISIFNGLHQAKMQVKGSPGLTLLIAPPSVGVVALERLLGDGTTFPVAAEFILGWNLVVFLLLAKIGPKIAATPPSFGVYWAYVFPLAALATACIRYAIVMNTPAARILAFITVFLATFAVSIVFCRMMIHIIKCLWFNGQWGDPLLGIPSKRGRDMFRWAKDGRWRPEADDMEGMSEEESMNNGEDIESERRSSMRLLATEEYIEDEIIEDQEQPRIEIHRHRQSTQLPDVT